MKTLSRRRGRGPIAAVIAAAGALVLSACTSVTYAETPLPRPGVVVDDSGPARDPGELRQPDPVLRSPAVHPVLGDITDESVRRILDRGHLVVGVSADTYLAPGTRSRISSRASTSTWPRRSPRASSAASRSCSCASSRPPTGSPCSRSARSTWWRAT